MNKLALITGATGGLGQALAERLLSDDWQLIVVSRDANKLKAVYGEKHIQIIADCSSSNGVQLLFNTIDTMQLLPIALTHCIGNIRLGAMHRMTEPDFMDCMRTNLFSAYFTLASFTQRLKEAKVGGSAVFVSSAAARIGTPNHEAIAAAKGGLEALVRSAAATYASIGLRVNAVAPGILDTPASAKILSSELTREMAAKQYPIHGIGDAAEVADLMAWLISKTAARVSGQIWSIDGGFTSIRPIVR